MNTAENQLKYFFKVEATFKREKVGLERLKKALIEAREEIENLGNYSVYNSKCFEWTESFGTLNGVHYQHELYKGFLKRLGDKLPCLCVNEKGTIIKFSLRRAESLEKLLEGHYINSICCLYNNKSMEFTDITGFYPRTIGECLFPMDEIPWEHVVNLRTKDNKDIRGRTFNIPGKPSYTHIQLEDGKMCPREDFVGWRYVPEENND